MWNRIDLMAEGDDAGGGTTAVAAPAAPAPPAPSPAPAAPSPAPAPAARAPAAPAAPAAAPVAAPVAAPAADDKPGYWPEDWRKTVSKDDAKILARLERYGSPEEMGKALIAAQNKISSGELKPVLGKDAKPEEVAEYRKALGIPADGKYDLKDVKVDAGDKPFVETLMKAALDSNQTTEQLAATVSTWNTIKAAAVEARAVKDQETQKTTEDALRAEWGTEYRRNINLVHGMLDGSGTPELKDSLLGGRLSDGTPIGSSAPALKMLLGLALVGNPAGVVVPGGAHNVKGVEDRIKEIETMMRTDRKAYNDPKISGPDGEYQRLIRARENIKQRDKA